MKKLLVVTLFFTLCSCGNLFVRNHYEFTYAFDNIGVSNSDKEHTITILKKRLTNVAKNVEVISNSENEIVIRLGSILSSERINSIVLNEGKLDLWLCLNKDEILSLISMANDPDLNILESLKTSSHYLDDFKVSVSDTIKVNAFFQKAAQQKELTEKFKSIKFLYSLPKDNFVSFYAVSTNEKVRATVNETHIVEATEGFDVVNRPTININMTSEGAVKWEEITKTAFEQRRKIAITINNSVYSAPSVSAGPIVGGKSQISGNFTIEEAQDLATVLNAKGTISKLKFIKASKLEGQ